MNFKIIIELLKETYADWNADKAPRLGAALAYYTVFSIAPLLIVVIAVASLVFGQEAARGELVKQIQGTVGHGAATAIQTMIQNAYKHKAGGSIVATVIGVATMLGGAAGLFGQLQDALNTIWGVMPKPGLGIMETVKNRFLSFAMVLGTGFLLLVSLALSAGLAALSKLMEQILPLPGGALEAINFLVSIGIITLLFAMIFKMLPDAEVDWHDVWIGAAMTALLFTIGKFALGWYLGRPGVESAYGQAGSLVLILLWVYYAAQILFFGAEFTKVYAKKYGSRIVPSADAIPITAEARAEQGMPGGGQSSGQSQTVWDNMLRQPARAQAIHSGSGGGPFSSGTVAAQPGRGPDMELIGAVMAGFLAVSFVSYLFRSKSEGD